MSQQKLTSFGKKVKRELIDLNMTQTELARKVGTTPQYLNLILYGHRTGNKYSTIGMVDIWHLPIQTLSEKSLDSYYFNWHFEHLYSAVSYHILVGKSF